MIDRSFRSSRFTSWRDLDVAQMHLWPHWPRRLMIATLAVVLLALGFYGLIRPLSARLIAEQQQVRTMQKQILKTHQVSPILLSNMPPIRQIKQSQEGVWLNELATLASNHRLTSVVLKTQDLDQTAHNQLRERIQTHLKNNLRLGNSQGGGLPAEGLGEVGRINISVQGQYSEILAFMSDLGARDEWLAIDEIELKATHQTQVHLKGGFWYYKEARYAAQ